MLAAVPLFNTLGYEFSLAIAAVLPLAAGLFWLSEVATPHKLQAVLIALALPPLVMAGNMLFVRNCAYLEGLVFYTLAVGAGTLFAVSLSGLIGSMRLSFKKSLFVLSYFLILLVPPLYRFYTTPQVYFFNHIFGFFAGSIYDDAVEIEPQYLLFRLETLALSAAMLAWQSKRALSPLLRRFILVLSLSTTVFLWLQSDTLGITSSRTAVMQALAPLDSHRFWYASPTLSSAKRAYFCERLKRELFDLQQWLELDTLLPVYVFIYPNAEIKKRYTGLDQTEIARVWMREVHITEQNFDAVIRHELVHVLMQPFGEKWLGLSRSIGLLEGIAVALETPSFEWTLDERAANLMETRTDLDPQSLFNAIGFWTGLGATNYTLTGSFVKHLLKTYGLQKFKAVYASANFEEVYGKSLEALLLEWLHYLSTVRVPPQIQPYYKQVYERQTIFQTECPHTIPKLLRQATRAYQAGQYDESAQLAADAIRLSDTSNADAVYRYLLAELARAHSGHISFQEVFEQGLRLTQDLEKPEWALFALANAMLWSQAAPVDSAKQILERLYWSHLSFEFDLALAIRLQYLYLGLDTRLLSPFLSPAERDARYRAILDTATAPLTRSFIYFLQAQHAFEACEFERALSLLAAVTPLEQRDLDLKTEMMRLQAYLWTGKLTEATLAAQRAKAYASRYANSKAKYQTIDYLLQLHSQYLELAGLCSAYAPQ
ncbi:MAG: hypothetical protein RML35_15620 [Chloroherpetonaceae bacterium]|nr:hypothetical protein [Chloroherpetonaceae bacterium]